MRPLGGARRLVYRSRTLPRGAPMMLPATSTLEPLSAMRPRSLRLAALLSLALAFTSGAAVAQPDRPVVPESTGTFLVMPYLQQGDAPAHGPIDGLQVLWQTDDEPAEWVVEYRP